MAKALVASVFLVLSTMAAASDDVVYAPADATVAGIAVEEARRVIQKMSSDTWLVPAWTGNLKARVTAVRIDEQQIVIEYIERRRGRPPEGKIVLKLEQMPKVELMNRPEWGIYFDRERETGLARWPYGPLSKEEYVRTADAFHALHLHAVNAKRDDARFLQVAAEYRAVAQKPLLGEDARKLKVQAEFMIREKRFPEAAALYAELLKSAPWFADGHYNRALVLAELKQYGQAIRQMKRYLQLEPDAPNARAVQDQIYQWEAAAR